MKLKVHIADELEIESIKALKKKLDPQIELTYGTKATISADYHVIVGGRLDKHHLTASPLLRTVVIPWSGLPQGMRLLLLDYPHLAVHNLHYNATSTAEMAVTLMVSAAKDVVRIDRSFREDNWGLRYLPSNATILKGKTALILGYGAIGREIATMCSGFQMQIVAIRRQAAGMQSNSTELHDISELEELLPRANVLFISLPYTPETKDMIGSKELSLLPDGAIIVNIARGRIVDEKALYQELKIGRLRAGLDVWYNYPEEASPKTESPPSKYPFRELDNVVMTPHLAGHTKDTEELLVEALAALLNLAATGESLPNVVDPKRGY